MKHPDQAKRCLVFGDLLIYGSEVACFLEYLPHENEYDARLISGKDFETFATPDLRKWKADKDKWPKLALLTDSKLTLENTANEFCVVKVERG
jgi:hypothetical protein